MPNLLDNTAAQNATTSNQGINKVPVLDAKSFFYLEDGVFNQTLVQSFGIVSEDEFRTTSTVSVINKKIVSVCSGQVFIQPTSGDNTKVNLILKPYKQPVNGLSIKYFIYRGLPISQFIESNGILKPTGTNGFTTHVWTEFQNFYQSIGETPVPFHSKFIGYPDPNATGDQIQEETDLIDSYFYKLSQTFDDETGDITNPKRSFDFPIIPAGTHLATVTSGTVGFDIVLNHGDYYIENDTSPFKFDLAFARAASNSINVASITGAYQKKLKREFITQFLDPAAYFGLHANGGKIFKFGVAQPIQSATDIYSLIGQFLTKNNIYLYVQSERQRSYNFYGKYKISETNTNNIKIGISEAGLVESTFETSEWPVKVFSTAPAAGAETQTIALQFTTDRNLNTSLFGVLANITSANQEGFVDAKDLIAEPDASGVGSNITKTILLSSPIANSLNIASLVKIIYQGQLIILEKPGADDNDVNTPDPDTIKFTTKYMDDVFYLTDAISFLQSDNIFHVHSYLPILYNQKDVDNNRSRVVSFTQRTQNTIAITDTENLTLFTYLSIVENEQSSHSGLSSNSSPNKEATGYSVQNLNNIYTLSCLPSNENIEIKSFSESGEAIRGLIVKTNDNSRPTTIMIGLSETENTILNSFNVNSKNVKMFFIPNLKNNESYTSPEKVKYKKYSLAVLADNDDFTPNLLQTIPTEIITVYSIDGLVFFSKAYSDNIKLESLVNNFFESDKNL